MSIFGKLFESKKPAPSYEIHPDDKNLIKNQDVDWWKDLSMDTLKEIELQDNVARMTAYKHFTETEGMSKEEALNEVKIAFYYSWAVESELNKECYNNWGQSKVKCLTDSLSG